MVESADYRHIFAVREAFVEGADADASHLRQPIGAGCSVASATKTRAEASRMASTVARERSCFACLLGRLERSVVTRVAALKPEWSEVD